MKNKIAFIFVGLFLLAVVLGCSSINPFSEKKSNTASNKTLTDQGVDAAVGEEKIGVAECDEVIDMLKEYANNPDDNFVVKAGKQMIVNRIRSAIKQSVEENKSDKLELAKNCKEFKTELDKAMAEQKAKEAK
jgi:hypothetical protein